jgi:hypothetical protein
MGLVTAGNSGIGLDPATWTNLHCISPDEAEVDTTLRNARRAGNGKGRVAPKFSTKMYVGDARLDIISV